MDRYTLRDNIFGILSLGVYPKRLKIAKALSLIGDLFSHLSLSAIHGSYWVWVLEHGRIKQKVGEPEHDLCHHSNFIDSQYSLYWFIKSMVFSLCPELDSKHCELAANLWLYFQAVSYQDSGDLTHMQLIFIKWEKMQIKFR